MCVFPGKELYLEIMNSSSQRNTTDLIPTLVILKGGIYLVNFIFITAVSILIIKTVRENSCMKKEVRYFLLCHHLLCSSLFCFFGAACSALQAFKVQNLGIWIIFGIQTAIGESVLVTLALMALNTSLAVCWPLRYLAFVHSVKHKVTVCSWIGTVLKSICLIILEYTEENPQHKFEMEPSCLTVLGGNFAKISGLVLISLLAATIVTSYFFLYREGKLTGHFNCSNKKARRTIVIHVLQMSLHILPPVIIIAIGKGMGTQNAIKFGAFVVFSFAQSFSPVVYGLRNKELQDKLYGTPCCRPLKRTQKQPGRFPAFLGTMYLLGLVLCADLKYK
uniref:G-protein coupled receptors family 1 profile domain-containing protein n=1 Tax=Varanus komodoensis TaxID=61221 RepID=A0A8D2L3X1_VARKO